MATTLTSLFQAITTEGLENALGRFYSFYQGKVEKDTQDPQARGRVEVVVDALGFMKKHGVLVSILSPFAGKDSGFYFPPYEEDKVFVSFDHGDINSPMLVGATWRTRDKKTVTDSDLPAEFVVKDKTTDPSTGTTKEFAVKPTVRGIKVRCGSALVFDETTEEEHVELWSGVSAGETGKRATKHHRVRLDNRKDNGQIVIATFGVEKQQKEETSDDDSVTERDRKELENHLRHQILMRDTADDRFVQVRTIGTEDGGEQKFHQILLSDKKKDDEKKIRIKSAEEHFFEIDDENETSTWSVKNGFKWLIDQKNKFMKGETPDGRSVTLSDNDKQILIEGPEHTLLFDTDGGTEISDTTGQSFLISSDGDLDESSGANHTLDVTGNSDVTIGGDLTTDVTGTHKLTVPTFEVQASNQMKIQGSQLQALCSQITLGNGATFALVDERFWVHYNAFIANFNAHLHAVTLPGAPSGPPYIPTTPAIAAAYQTAQTKAG